MCLLQLLYLCVDGNAELGLAKALSTVTGEDISLNEVGGVSTPSHCWTLTSCHSTT